MKSGVRKSGWPMPRLMISRPCAASALARASTAKAFSSPMRSKAAMVRSILTVLYLRCRIVDPANRLRLTMVLWRHPGRRDLRRPQAHLIKRAPHQAGRLGLLDERRHIGERGRLVLGHRHRGGRVEKAAVEGPRSGHDLDEREDGLTRQRDRVDLAGAH